MVEPRINDAQQDPDPIFGMCLGRGHEDYFWHETEEPLDITKAQQWLDNNPKIYDTPGLKIGDWEGSFGADNPEKANSNLAKHRVTLIAYSPQEEIAKEMENPLDNIIDEFETDKHFIAHINYEPEAPRYGYDTRKVNTKFTIEMYYRPAGHMEYRVANNMLDAVELFIDFWYVTTDQIDMEML